jgi:hypothetical protein
MRCLHARTTRALEIISNAQGDSSSALVQKRGESRSLKNVEGLWVRLEK